MAYRLDERKWRVLRAVIRDYILTALPVGSEKITKKYRLNMSPATARNIMAYLEEKGFLEQPHVSSGRIPTDLGFRYYVDALMDPKPLRREVKDLIVSRFQDTTQGVGEIMQETSRILSHITRYTGVVSAPRLSQTVFDRIEFIRLDSARILAVLISNTGVLYNRILEGVSGFSQKDLNQAAEYFNLYIKRLSLSEAKEKIIEQMETEKIQYDRILGRLWSLKKWVREEDRTEVYIDGQSNILDYPEFSDDVKKMKVLLNAFEEKEMLLQLLDKAMGGEGIQVYIGIESQWNEMAECSLIFSSYYQGGVPQGTLGVIGPKRMDYSRVIPLVEFAAKAVGEKLEQIGGY